MADLPTSAFLDTANGSFVWLPKTSNDARQGKRFLFKKRIE